MVQLWNYLIELFMVGALSASRPVRSAPAKTAATQTAVDRFVDSRFQFGSEFAAVIAG
jgi:hypothetical protein